VRVPAPRQTITSEKTEAFVEPGFTWVLMNLAGDPATYRILLPGDIGGVEAADAGLDFCELLKNFCLQVKAEVFL